MLQLWFFPHIYTMTQKNTQSFCDNYGKHTPVLIILSLLHADINTAEETGISATSPQNVATLPCEICSTVHSYLPDIYMSNINFVLQW